MFKKEKALEPGDDPMFGDAYTFVAIERHTKLVLNFALGKRNQATTGAFIEGLRAATSSQEFQITTDGFVPYGQPSGELTIAIESCHTSLV